MDRRSKYRPKTSVLSYIRYTIVQQLLPGGAPFHLLGLSSSFQVGRNGSGTFSMLLIKMSIASEDLMARFAISRSCFSLVFSSSCCRS